MKGIIICTVSGIGANCTFSADLMSPIFLAGTCTSSFFFAAGASSAMYVDKGHFK